MKQRANEMADNMWMRSINQRKERTRKMLPKMKLEEKIKFGEDIIKQTLEQWGSEHVVVAWTGGKDSTVLLWLVRNVCTKNKIGLPVCMFVDEGDVFEEIKLFVDQVAKKWKLRVSVAHNHDVSSKAVELGDVIQVKELNLKNRREIAKLGYTETSFEYWPESLVGNHLMKTAATNEWLKKIRLKYY